MALIIVQNGNVIGAVVSGTPVVDDTIRLIVGTVAYWHETGHSLTTHDFGAGVHDAIIADTPNDYAWDGTTLTLSAAGIARRNAKPPVPESVTPAQARVALVNASLFDAADAAVNATGVNGVTWQWWHYATEFRRDSPTLNALAQTLTLTSAQVDDLFRAAWLLEA